jgi:hypothetical protein
MILEFTDLFITEIFSHLAKCLFFLAKKLAKQTILVSKNNILPEPAKGQATHTRKISWCSHFQSAWYV